MEKTDRKALLRNLQDDPRRILKTIRLAGETSVSFCRRCGSTVQVKNSTTELSRRLDGDKLVFFQRCPECGHKLYWTEYHCFTYKTDKK